MKSIIESYITIFNRHPMADSNRIAEIMTENKFKYNLGTLMDLSRYYDEIDSKDERNSINDVIEKYQLQDLH